MKPDVNRPLLETIVKPIGKGGGSFTGVANAIGSPVLGGTTTLGALWAANPDLRHVPIPTDAGLWPRALDIPIGIQRMSTGIYGDELPDPWATPVVTGGMVVTTIDCPGETSDEVAEAIQPYPTLRGAFALTPGGMSSAVRGAADDVVVRSAMGGPDRVAIGVKAPAETTMADQWERLRALASVVEIDSSQPVHPVPSLVGFALPEVGGARAPSPLLLWWALLLGLSILARYEPAAWTLAVDLDVSTLAVGLERVLDVAAERVPMRILDGLRVT